MKWCLMILKSLASWFAYHLTGEYFYITNTDKKASQLPKSNHCFTCLHLAFSSIALTGFKNVLLP
jgi:hypothetical protein